MGHLTDYLPLALDAVRLLAHLALTLLCLARLRHAWAVVGLVAGLLSLVATGWATWVDLLLRFGTPRLDSPALDPTLQAVVGVVATLATVLLVVAVLLGRRPPEPEAAGPTGTTFRQLPSGIRWE